MGNIPKVAFHLFVLGIVAFVALGGSLVATYPVEGNSAADHVIESTETSQNYIWTCPVFDSPSSTSPNSWKTEVFSLDISESDFRNSMRQPVFRQSTAMDRDCGHMIRSEDRFVRSVASYIDSVVAGSDYQKSLAAVNFVCSLSYKADSTLYGTSEFWAFPLETLYCHGGDCEDLSILLCSICLAMGIDSVLLDLPGHVAVGIAATGGVGAGIAAGDTSYLYCETTLPAPVSKIGCVPSGVGDIAVLHPAKCSVAGHFLAQYREFIYDLIGS